MENWSNSNPSRHSSPLRLLWLMLLFMLCRYGAAQPVFNKLYTLNATAASFDAVVPQGTDGGFMAAGTVVDSLSGKQGIRIARFDALGNLETSQYFNVPDDTARTIWMNADAAVRIHDNKFAIAGTLLDDKNKYSIVLLTDSNCVVTQFKEILYFDSTNTMTDIQFDGEGHLIACGIFNRSKGSDIIIYKMDTLLNTVWVKSYHPSEFLVGVLNHRLMIDKNGYTLNGTSINNFPSNWKEYKEMTTLFRTDTAGTQQWAWASKVDSAKNYLSGSSSALHTADGGYIFATYGLTFNRLGPESPVVELYAKKMLIKLDADRKQQWQVIIDDYFSGFGSFFSRLIELEDSSFIYLGPKTTDSLEKNIQIGFLVMQHYSKDGLLLAQRIIDKHYPRASDDTHKESQGRPYDFVQLPDKGFLLGGYYDNRTTGAPLPKQRAWVLKLNSNMCLGTEDPQCDPASIVPITPQNYKSISVYPNPSYNIFNFDCTLNSDNTLELSICDLYGRPISQHLLGNGTTSLDARNWANGIYLYRVQQGTKIISNGKLVKF